MSTIIVKVAFRTYSYLNALLNVITIIIILLFKVLKLIHVHLSFSLKYSVLYHIQIMYMYMYMYTVSVYVQNKITTSSLINTSSPIIYYMSLTSLELPKVNLRPRRKSNHYDKPPPSLAGEEIRYASSHLTSVAHLWSSNVYLMIIISDVIHIHLQRCIVRSGVL